jgi:hypothetical protein
MTGSCWRLLACFLFIFLPPALRAQDAAADRSAAIAPSLALSPSTVLYRTVPLPLPVDGPWRNSAVRGTIALPQVIRAAGIIFSGRVTFVGRADGGVASTSPQSASSTSVTFQVEHALRGTVDGQSLTIHEWSGLWTGRERYRIGERVFLFLYPPSKLGLTSSVAGAVGRFAIDPRGKIAMTAQNVSAVAADPVIGGRRVVSYADFIQAVRRAGGLE